MMMQQDKKKILIIDDDKLFLETMRTVLELHDFAVLTAETAESGFEAMVNTQPDLIILDINLPDKNGFDVLVTIKSSKSFSVIPVILITGDMTVHIDEGFAKGADDCLLKPMNPETTIASINKLLKK